MRYWAIVALLTVHAEKLARKLFGDAAVDDAQQGIVQ